MEWQARALIAAAGNAARCRWPPGTDGTVRALIIQQAHVPFKFAASVKTAHAPCSKALAGKV